MSADQYQQPNQDQDVLSSFDPEKFKVILGKSWIYLIAFLVITVSGAYLFVRYTKPVFESSSIVKLNFESEASVLEISSPVLKQEGEISGEIELLKSRLFFGKVAEAVDMDVSYYRYGRVLDDERYGINPFEVSYKVKNAAFYNRPIDLAILDDTSFELTAGGETNVYQFDQDISSKDFNLLVTKTEYFGNGSVGPYYFTINTDDAIVDFLQEKVNVVPESFTAKTLKISIQDYNRKKAQVLVNAIDSIYEIYTREAKNRALEQKIEFLDQRIDATEEILQNYENYFENFTIQNRSTNLGNDLNKTIAQLDELDSIQFRLKSRNSEITILKENLESGEPLLMNEVFVEKFPESVVSLIKLYQESIKERSMKLSSYSENTFVIKQLNEEIDLTKTRLLAAVNGYQENIESQIRNIASRKSILESTLLQLPSLETEYSKNRRLYAQQEEFMLALRQAKMEIEITRAGTVTDIVILSPASYPSVPVQPQKMLVYAFGVVAGLIIGVVFLLLRYLINNKITGLGELERLIHVPILGSIPFYRQEKLPNTKMVIEKDSKSSLSEALRTIRTNMEFMNGTGTKHTISITSTVSGEGKTFIGVNLGAIIALSGQKVCVVDIDMRKPKIHLAFENQTNSKGVSTILAGKSKIKDSLVDTKIENLTYLAAGPTPPNPSELLLGESFDKMIEELQKEFDTVILDTPPVGLVTDGILVMKKADLQLYVVRSGYSKRNYLRTIDNLKKTNRFEKLTVVFNSLKGTGGYGYGYGYGHGYGHGYYEEANSGHGFLTSVKSLF